MKSQTRKFSPLVMVGVFLFIVMFVITLFSVNKTAEYKKQQHEMQIEYETLLQDYQDLKFSYRELLEYSYQFEDVK